MGSVTNGHIVGRIADVKDVEWAALMAQADEGAGFGDSVFGEAIRGHLARRQATANGTVDGPAEAVSAFANFAAPQ